VLSFLSFGYATEEFEVTEERLGVYRPEEHIDNPKDYADNKDARQYDPRLRGPVAGIELEVDLHTGMKNYIANENGGWATSAGYIKFSFSRSIHYGRVYTNGSGNTKGKEADLCEALRFVLLPRSSLVINLLTYSSDVLDKVCIAWRSVN